MSFTAQAWLVNFEKSLAEGPMHFSQKNDEIKTH
jgi:hypothetical protein